jgi:glutathione S-transferase
MAMMPISTHVPHRVYGTATSGNCHKVRIAMTALGLAYRWHEVDIMKGESRTPEFLRMNANGKVPLLQIDDHTFLPESNAILCYLADGTPLWPGDRLQRARVLEWLFFEQYSHEPYVAVARFIRVFAKKPDDPRLPNCEKRGYDALGVMETHLARQPFFAGDTLTIADIALFAYTCVADTGGFDLARFPKVRAWLDRCLAQPGVTPTPNP